jgi:SAM-dependent methyltransferase
MDREYIHCPLCGQDQPRPLFISRDRLMAISGEFQVVQCRACGLVYINPRPTVAALARYYPPDLPINELKPVSENGRLKEKALTLLARLYGHHRARWIENHVLVLSDATRVLDVGCGTASFLYYLKSRQQCQTYGVDINPAVVDYVRRQLNIPIYEGVLADADFEENSFDLMTMWHFIEHDLEPVRTLRRAWDFLKRDGYLVLETPNIACPVATLFGNRWSQIHPRHQILYSPETLGHLLTHCGFQVVKLARTPLAVSFGVSMLFALGLEGFRNRTPLSPKIVTATVLLMGLVPANLLVNLLWPECIRVVAQKAQWHRL